MLKIINELTAAATAYSMDKKSRKGMERSAKSSRLLPTPRVGPSRDLSPMGWEGPSRQK
mgnify:CR=1 FL=1